MDEDKLKSLIYRHAVAAKDIPAADAAKIVKLLNSKDAELIDRLTARYSLIEADGFDAGPATTKRIQDIQAAFAELNRKVYKLAAEGLTDQLTDTASYYAELVGKQAKAAGAAIDLAATVPDGKFLRSLVTTTPLPFADDGFTKLMPWLDVQEAGRLRRLEGALQRGIAEGQSTGELVKAIRGTKANNFTDGILQTSRKDATTIALTANAAVQNAARLETFKRMPGIAYVEWSAILDSRTSQICQGRSGTVYPIDKPHPKPPAHPRCRSLLLPRKDAEGSKHEPYGAWLRKQPEGVQDDVLGKARADLFRANPNFDFQGFFKESGGYKSLDDLRKFDDGLFSGTATSSAKLAPKAPAPDLTLKIDTKPIDDREKAYLLERGKKTGVEHLVAYDERTGTVVERKKGKKSSVSFSPELVTALDNPSNSIVLHHNHPGSSSLSLADLMITQRPGAKAIWAHGHNGSSFYAERGTASLQKATARALSSAIQAVLQRLVNAGTVPIHDAILLHNHLTWLALDRGGQIRYRSELAGESKEAFERNRKIYEKLLEELK